MVKKYLRETLKKKGWQEREIRETMKDLERVSEHDVHFSKVVFYSALLLIVFANVMMAFALMFISILISPLLLYLLVIVLALVMGFLYNYLILDVGHVGKEHHILALITIPLIAFINVVIMVLVGNSLIKSLEIVNVPHNPWLVGVVFSVFLLFPSLIEKLSGMRKK